jgi:hypothetical protein
MPKRKRRVRKEGMAALQMQLRDVTEKGVIMLNICKTKKRKKTSWKR